MKRLFIILVITLAICLAPALLILGGAGGGILVGYYLAIVAPPLIVFAIWKTVQKENAGAGWSARAGIFIVLIGLVSLLIFALGLAYVMFGP